MKFPPMNNITFWRSVKRERVWQMIVKRGISSGHFSREPISDKGRMPPHKLNIEGVNDIIAVASGKGGVGKSTTAVNLAVSLAVTCRLKVGLLDADVYGPSIPTMMNLQGRPQVTEDFVNVYRFEKYTVKVDHTVFEEREKKAAMFQETWLILEWLSVDMKMVPMENHGVKCISMGFLTEKDAPIVWRGPMVMSALEKLTRGVAWGNIDILVADMPPGTGDAQLSMSQRLQLSGAVIVSTPQDIALLDARKGANMFRKVEVPILGLVENMSCFKCPHCGQDSYIFGNRGAQRTAQEMEMEFLGEVPLNTEIRETSDAGNPVVVAYPDCEASEAYRRIAGRIVEKLHDLKSSKVSTPQIII